MARGTLPMRRTPKLRRRRGRCRDGRGRRRRVGLARRDWVASHSRRGPLCRRRPDHGRLERGSRRFRRRRAHRRLVGLGIPEFEAKRYEGKLKEGNILISVHSEDSKQTDRAEQDSQGRPCAGHFLRDRERREIAEARCRIGMNFLGGVMQFCPSAASRNRFRPPSDQSNDRRLWHDEGFDGYDCEFYFQYQPK